MTASLLLSQNPYQVQSAGIERGMTETSAQNRLAVLKSNDASYRENDESFLKTFEQISKDVNPYKPSRNDDRGESSQDHANNLSDKFHTNSPFIATGTGTETDKKTKIIETNLQNVDGQDLSDLNLNEIISILEKLGFYDSTGVPDADIKVGGESSDTGGLVGLKLLFDRFERNDLVASPETKAELDRLLQLISIGQTENGLSHNIENPLGGLSEGERTGLVDLNQLTKRIDSEQKELSPSTFAQVREGNWEAESSNELSKTNIVDPELSKDPKLTKSLLSTDNYQTVTKTEMRDKTDLMRVTADSRPAEAGVDENAKELKKVESFRTETIGFKESSNKSDQPDAPIHKNQLNQITSTISTGKKFGEESAQQNLANAEPSPAIKITKDVETAKTLKAIQSYGGESAQNNSVNTDSSPVSKMIQDAQMAKENNLKIDATMGDQLSGKITKVDVGTNDSDLFGSQNQSQEKAGAVTASSKPTDTGHDNLRSQTFEQIVRKAVIYVRNGQHEAKIDLKPEFLGHVRMQITTENHQVTVKIVTELPITKDLIDNNIQQLKSDLQQQGLNVDKLEVSVSNNSDKYENPQQTAGRSKNKHNNASNQNSENPETESLKQKGNSVLREDGSSTVDYFA
jgi:flagellar hook-length control protein FliK